MAVWSRNVTEKADKKSFDDVESRRSAYSQRRMSPGRRLYYFLGVPLLRGVARLLWSSYRFEKLIGEDIADKIVTNGKVYAPCYWHQHTILCLYLIRSWIKRGFSAGFIVSASVDGDVPAKIATAWGAKVVRGSAVRTGALAMRDIHQVMKSGCSIVTAADGPGGPKYGFKSGVVLMSRIGSAPMIPIACAASSAWYLDRWDNFMVPKPFSRIVMAVGEPQQVPPGSSIDQMEQHRASMEAAILDLMRQAEQALASRASQ
jgi:hypothetical protein